MSTPLSHSITVSSLPGRTVCAVVCAATIAFGARAADVVVRVTDGGGAPVADAVVVVEGVEAAPGDAAAGSVQIDQVDKQFVPVVSVVRTGTAVEFPNNDHIRHHVYSFSPAKSFELPLYAGVPAHPVVFDRPGIVTLGCNIHDWMLAYVYVTDSPQFAKTDAQGQATLHGVPGGARHLTLWHPGAEGQATVHDVTVPASGTAAVTWQVDIKSSWPPRRPPAIGAGGARY